MILNDDDDDDDASAKVAQEAVEKAVKVIQDVCLQALKRLQLKLTTASVLWTRSSEATETHMKEHDDFTESLAADAAAVDLLNFAKNRLNNVYNPKQYKPPPKRDLSEEEQITSNMDMSSLDRLIKAKTAEVEASTELKKRPSEFVILE